MNKSVYEYERKQQTCKKLGISENQFSYIKRIGTILENLYTNECNGFYNEWTGKEDERQAKRNTRAIKRYERIAGKFAKDNNLYLYLQTDPRGASIYLDTKEIPENNYTTAVCIY